MALNHVTLEDKYDLGKSRIFVTGFQALVRLCMMQKERDRRAGLNTAGYVTGYRGSPLGTLDQQFIRAQRQLDRHDIRFQAGINEDIAATALWGSQQAELRGEGKFEGSIAPATCSGTRISPALLNTAACSRSWATTTRPNPPPRHINPSITSSM
jgi:hypothetical protein